MSELFNNYTLHVELDQPARNMVKDPHGCYLTIGLRPRTRYYNMGLSEPEVRQFQTIIHRITGVDPERQKEYQEKMPKKLGETNEKSIDIPMQDIDRERVIRCLENPDIIDKIGELPEKGI